MSFIGSSPTCAAIGVKRSSGAQLEADALSLQLRNSVNVFLSEELKAAGVQTSEHGQWYAGIERLELLDRETRDKIDLTASHRIVGGEPVDGFDISDVGKSLSAQQFFGHVYGRTADRGAPEQPDRGRLECFLPRQKSPRTDEICCSRQ